MAGLDPAAIALAPGTEPFALAPVIEDMARTRFCVPGSVFLVEAVDAVPMTRTGRWQAVRLLLGDGQLCVQALLDAALHCFVQTGEVAVGCYVRVQHFDLRWSNAAGGPDADGGSTSRASMAYLVLRDLVTIGWNETVAALHRSLGPPRTVPSPEDAPHGEAEGPGAPAQADEIRAGETDDGETDDGDLEDASDTFEALAVPTHKAPSPQPRGAPATKPDAAKPALPVALARDWHDPQTPLKQKTLRAVPHLPYAQNWSCNVLAVVASLSGVEPSRLPPYKQRSARIADPSTAKQVHLIVFLDPDDFVPAVGSAVLLTGVKNHRFDGGSLEKYASDGRPGARWWFEDPWELAWCDVAGIKQWWAAMEAALAP